MGQRPWFTGLAIGLMVIIGLSRIYLGVHFSTDGLMGWSIGLVVLWLFNRLAHRVMAKLRSQRFAAQLLTVWVTSLALLLPSLLMVSLFGSWDMPAAWMQSLQTSVAPRPFP